MTRYAPTRSLVNSTPDFPNGLTVSLGNVGIGTSSPGSLGKLVVVGGPIVANGGGTADPEFRLSGASGSVTQNWAMGTDSTQRLYWYDWTASAYRMVITSAGKVGIGTATPSAYGALTVAGDVFVGPVGSGGYGRLAYNTTLVSLQSNVYWNGTNNLSSVAGHSSLLDLRLDDGSIRFSTSASVAVNTALVMTERMRITSAGNVGIGTTTPGALLDIQGTSESLYLLRANGANSNAPNLRIRKSRGTAASKSLIVNGDYLGHITWEGYDGVNFIEGAGIYGISNGTVAVGSIPSDLAFYTNPGGVSQGLERMRITAAGNLYLGTTSPGTARDFVLEKTTVGETVFAIRNLSTSLSSYSAFLMGNSTQENMFVIFTNSTGRTDDGGVNTTTIRTDSGNLRIITAGTLRIGLATAPTVGQVLAATDTSGTLGWSSGTTYYRQFMFTS